MIDAIRETAVLANVSISMWGGTSTDNNLLSEVKKQHNATGDVGRVIKNKLAGADEKLKITRSAHAAVRTKFYELTLSWVSDPHALRQTGPRLLPHALFNTFMTEMGRLKREAEAALEDFLADYPSLVTKAKANLGTMADTNYPDVDELRGLFRISFDWEPIPDGSQFRGLESNVLGKLSNHLHKKQQRQIAGAQAEMWAEARQRVEHMVERLATTTGSDAPKFKSATIDAVRSLITLMPGWNITGDPKVAEITQDLERLLLGVDAQELRKDERMRNDVAQQARSVADKMKSWGV
jgi:hypothetical protein